MIGVQTRAMSCGEKKEPKKHYIKARHFTVLWNVVEYES
jgi:hypothetical protein